MNFYQLFNIYAVPDCVTWILHYIALLGLLYHKPPVVYPINILTIYFNSHITDIFLERGKKHYTRMGDMGLFHTLNI